MSLPESVRDAFLLQGRGCAHLGSPFSAALLELGAGPLGGEVASLVEPWAGADVQRLFDAAVPIRWIGGLHHLVLTSAEPELAALYPAPGHGTDAAALEPVLREVLGRRQAELAAFMRSPPQTNEVRRALPLLGGFLTMAQESGLPLRCFEIGASAGLLQNWEAYAYDFGGGASWGDPASPVRIGGDWSGGLPPLPPVSVVERLGCDVAPIALDAANALKLQAYVWADQFDRLERLRAAIALARARGVRLERADAGEWIARAVRPQPGAATVLHHSVMWQYMPRETQAAARAAIEAAGALATPEAPFAWLRMEPPEGRITATMDIRLTLWPTGEERLLARTHPHGAAVEWLGA